VPELPEVETLARDLQGLLVGAEIEAVKVCWSRTVAVPTAEALTEQLPRRSIVGVSRRGKFLVISLSDSSYLLIHLRMSGQLRVEPASCSPDGHARLIFQLTDGRQLVFSDTRKFGRVYWTRDPCDVVGDLGPEPLAEDFTLHDFAAALTRRRGAIKPLLLNQRFLAGLGNIYTDEALFLAGLHPLRKADTLTAAEVERLYRAIREVLGQAIDSRGTTLDDERYLDAEGWPGRYGELLRVYHRAGEPCPRCGEPIERIVVGGRSTHLCSRCQDYSTRSEDLPSTSGSKGNR
jgi:formamidopyrimidine-DNA glycosylase